MTPACVRLPRVAIALLAAVLLPPVPSRADEVRPDLATTTTQVSTPRGENARGSELRPRVDEVMRLMQQRRWDEAEAKGAALKAAFEALFDPARRHVAFQSERERNEYLPDSNPAFERVDYAYVDLLDSLSWLASERHQYERALGLLQAVQAVAPTSASAYNEAGFVLVQLKRQQEGLASYRKAADLAVRFPSQMGYRAIALRGIGVTLSDIGEFDEAERVLRQSLLLEPGSRVALGELDYIRHQRAMHPAASSPMPAAGGVE